jgi:hypothetical protein
MLGPRTDGGFLGSGRVSPSQVNGRRGTHHRR